MLSNQIIVIQVDNIGCHFAWLNGYASGDNLASILVRMLVLITTLISSEVIIVHHPRESSWESKLADRLTRERSTTNNDRRLIQNFSDKKLPVSFSSWMERPTENWNLAKEFLEFSVKTYGEIWRGGGDFLSAIYASESGMGF